MTVHEANLFTKKELEEACLKTKNIKAPGHDRILPEIVKLTVSLKSELVLKVMNNLLKN